MMTKPSQTPKKSKPFRIVISGYYGFSNLGDEAILTALRQALLRQNPDAVLTVLSADPEATKASHQIAAISRTDFLAIWRALGESDLLISGGGSLLQDVTSSRSLRYYLAILWLAFLRRCPFMIYAQGIGPLHQPLNRRLTSWILQRAAAITVRDAESIAELQRLGLRPEKMMLSADPVLLFQRPQPELGQRLLQQLNLPAGSGPLIGVSVRPWGDPSRWTPELAAALDRLIEEQGARICFISMQEPDDETIVRLVLDQLRNRSQAVALPAGHHVEEVISLIDACDLMIGVRLHALVLAAVAQTKAVAIRYDPKVDHFAKRVGQTPGGSLQELQREELYRVVSRLLRQPEPENGAAERCLNDLRQQASASAELAFQLMEAKRHEQ